MRPRPRCKEKRPAARRRVENSAFQETWFPPVARVSLCKPRPERCPGPVLLRSKCSQYPPFCRTRACGIRGEFMVLAARSRLSSHRPGSGLPSPPRKKATQGLESCPSVPFFDTVPALEKRSHTAAARPTARARPFAHPRITHRFGRHFRVGLRMGRETLHGRRVDALRHHNDSSDGHDLVSERNRRLGKGWVRRGWSVSARHSRFRLGMPAAVSGAGRFEGPGILVSRFPATPGWHRCPETTPLRPGIRRCGAPRAG